MSRLTASLLVLLAAVIWGIAFYFQKSAMDDVGPLQFLGFRGLLASVALAPFAVWEGRRVLAQRGGASSLHAPTFNAVLPVAALGGAMFFAAAAVQQVGIVSATVTNTGFLTALYVVVTPFLLWLLAREKPGARVWLAAFIACLGIWALGGGTLGSFSAGDRLVALSSIGWSLFMVITSKAGRHGRPVLYTCLSFVVVAVLAWSASAIWETHSLAAMRAAWLPILYVGILSSAFTFALTAIAVRHIPATHVAILLSTETLVAAAAGHVMRDERLSALGWAGASLVLAAVLLIQLKPKRQQMAGQQE